MGIFKINFTLQQLDKIIPWGEKPDLMLHWFGLTDGLLWITVGTQTIYEYSDEAQKYFGTDIRYNDYQLSRFLEDFSATFPYICESIPQPFFDKIEEFDKQANTWIEYHVNEGSEDDIELFEQFYDNQYEPMTRWYHERSFDSGHLVNGPYIGCFRCGSRIKICWESDGTMENGGNIWTSPKGVFELSYDDFVTAVNDFFYSFFRHMDKQVEAAVQKDWKEIRIDKEQLIKENIERRQGFKHMLGFLLKPGDKTDWNKELTLYNVMKRELEVCSVPLTTGWTSSPGKLKDYRNE